MESKTSSILPERNPAATPPRKLEKSARATKVQRTFYLSGSDINYKETDSEGNVAVTGFVATLQAGDHDFTPPVKAFELGLDLVTKANLHEHMLAALKAISHSGAGRNDVLRSFMEHNSIHYLPTESPSEWMAIIALWAIAKAERGL